MPKSNKVGGAYVPPSCLGAALKKSKPHKAVGVGLLLNNGQIVLITANTDDPFAGIKAMEKHRELRQEIANAKAE